MWSPVLRSCLRNGSSEYSGQQGGVQTFRARASQEGGSRLDGPGQPGNTSLSEQDGVGPPEPEGIQQTLK